MAKMIPFLRLLMVCGFVCLTAACAETQKRANEAFTSVLGASEADRDKKVQEISDQDRSMIMEFVYKEDIIYLSPAAEDAAFSNFNSFLWNVLAGLADYPTLWLPFAANDPALAEQVTAMGPIWKLNKDIIKTTYGPVLQQRRDAVSKRLGDKDDEMMNFTIRDIIWDSATFNKFMTDDQFAADTYGHSAEVEDSSHVLLGKNPPYSPEGAAAYSAQMLQIIISATTGS